MKQISDVIPENVFMIVAGNKIDCENNRYNYLIPVKFQKQRVKITLKRITCYMLKSLRKQVKIYPSYLMYLLNNLANNKLYLCIK